MGMKAEEALAIAISKINSGGGGTGEGDMKKSVYDSDSAVKDAGGIAEYVANEIDDLNLGTASSKNSINEVTQGSEDLVESGAVFAAVKAVVQDLNGVSSAVSGLQTAVVNLGKYKAEADSIAPVELDATGASQAYAVDEQFYLIDVLLTATSPISQGSAIVVYPTSGYNCKPSDSITEQIATKADKSDLGTASAKNATSIVTQSSDLVESGAVYDAIQEFTKKVSNNEVYGLRQGKGNMVDLDLVGGSLAWNQLVNTANFPSVESSFTNGVKVSAVDTSKCEVTITVDTGGATDTRVIFVQLGATIQNNRVRLVKGCPSNGGLSRYGINLYTTSQDGAGAWDYGNGSITKVQTFDSKYFGLVIFSGCPAGTYVFKPQVIDLTQLFGSTIADYIYSLEQATAGAGVEWFKQYFPNDYYAYSTGAIQSVNVASRKVYDADNNLVSTYPFDSTKQLRGIPKLVDNKLSYDGDIYKADGSVTRKYGIVDLGSLTWNRGSTSASGAYRFTASAVNVKPTASNSDIPNAICQKYITVSPSDTYNLIDGVSITTSGVVVVYIDAYKAEIAENFKTAMSGVYLVYEFATPTTEAAQPFQNLQRAYSDGTEEFIDAGVSAGTRDVSIPVGNDSVYYLSDALPAVEDYADGAVKDRMTYADNGVLGAKNLLPAKLSNIKAINNFGTWSNNVYTYNGVDYTFTEENGYVTKINVNGTASDLSVLNLCNGIKSLVGGRYILSGCPSGGSASTYYLQGYRVESVDGRSGSAQDTGNGVAFDYLNTVTNDRFSIIVIKNKTVNADFYPMLRLVTDTDPTYQPYAQTNRELTVNKADNSVIAPVEDGATCNNPNGYAIGEHFQKNGKFCTATAAIAYGATFTLNTNYVEGTIADYLTDMLKEKAGSLTGYTNTVTFEHPIVYERGLTATVSARINKSDGLVAGWNNLATISGIKSSENRDIRFAGVYTDVESGTPTIPYLCKLYNNVIAVYSNVAVSGTVKIDFIVNY